MKFPAGIKRLATNELFLLSLILALAIGLRLFYLWGHPLETKDGLFYVEQTQQWFIDGEWQKQDPFLQAPPVLYCYLSKNLMYLGLSAENSTLLVNFLAGVALLIPVWLTGRVLFEDNKYEALLLSLFAAVFPKLIQYSCERLREGLFLFFSAWIFYLLFFTILRKKKKMVTAALCGIFAAFSMTCRYEALELVLFCFGSISIAAFIKEKRVGSATKYASLFLLGLIVGFTFLSILPGFPNLLPTYLTRLREL